jgi:predicted neuraminidase
VSPEPVPHWNPVLADLGDGKIALYYKVGKEIASWQTMVRYSHDKGETWSTPTELVPGDKGGRGPVRCKVIRAINGQLLAPSSVEWEGKWEAFADYSDDNGESWQQSNVIKVQKDKIDKVTKVTNSTVEVSEQSFYGRGVIQPTLWESERNQIHMMLRSTEGYIYRSDSADGGRIWCSPYPTQLPNNNSGIDVEKGVDGLLVLASNPVSANWGNRTPINLSVSMDNGKSWESLLDLDSGVGEFSYPAVVYKGGIFHITYTWKRENIAYWQIKIEGGDSIE